MIYDLQKAGTWKRCSAFLFDFIISGVLIVGVVLIFVWAFGFDDHTQTFKEKQQFYADKYGIDLEMTSDDYEGMSDAEKQDYNTRLEASNADIAKDMEAVKAYNMIIYLPFVFVTLGTFLVYTVYEFVLPLIFKNGQTLGKKIFGIGVVHTNCVKASNLSLFVRVVFGKFAIETMVPIFIAFTTITGLLNPLVSLVVLLGIVILELVSFLRTKRTRSLIHDLIANTAVVELSTQLVFDSEAELIAYKNKIHEEAVARSPY